MQHNFEETLKNENSVLRFDRKEINKKCIQSSPSLILRSQNLILR